MTRQRARRSGSLSGPVLRAVVFAGPVSGLLAGGLGGTWPPVWLVVVVAVVGAGFAARPESAVGTLAFVAVVLWWGLAEHPDVPLATVAAALFLIASHVAAVLLAHGPPGLPLDPRVLRRWLRRAAAVGCAAPAVWVLAVAVDGHPEPPGVWVAGLVSAVVVAVVAAVAVAVPDRAP